MTYLSCRTPNHVTSTVTTPLVVVSIWSARLVQHPVTSCEALHHQALSGSFLATSHPSRWSIQHIIIFKLNNHLLKPYYVRGNASLPLFIGVLLFLPNLCRPLFPRLWNREVVFYLWGLNGIMHIEDSSLCPHTAGAQRMQAMCHHPGHLNI